MEVAVVAFVVIARWTAQPGNEADVWHAIGRLVEPSRQEPGCLAYVAHRSVEDERTFLLYEQYVDQAAYEAHAASEHFKTYALDLGIPLLEARERSFYITDPPE